MEDTLARSTFGGRGGARFQQTPARTFDLAKPGGSAGRRRTARDRESESTYQYAHNRPVMARASVQLVILWGSMRRTF